MKTPKYNARRNKFSIINSLAVPVSVALIAVLSGPVATSRATDATVSGTVTITTGLYSYDELLVGYTSAGTLNINGATFTNSGVDGPVIDGYTSGDPGTINLSAGTLNANGGGTAEIIGYSSVGTFAQTGGLNAVAGSLEIGYIKAGAYTISSGSLNVTGSLQDGDDANTSSFSQTGGVVTAGTLNVTGYTASSIATYTLGGGTLITGQILPNDGTTGGTSSTFNFNGGTLQPAANSTAFMANLTTANVQTGGAIINTNGFNITIAQTLVHSGTTDGGLTKLGGGTLTLSGPNTYTGGTNVTGGVLSLGNSGAIGTAGTVLFLGGTLQYSASNQVDYSGRFGTTAGQALNIDTNGQNVTYASQFSPSSGGTLTKIGAGTLTLNSGASGYSGGTSITAGTLLLTNTSDSGAKAATGTGPVSIGTGSTLASGAGTTGAVLGLVTTVGPTSQIAPGATATALTGTVGALTLNGGLNIASGANIKFDLGSTQVLSDLITTTTLTAGTTVGSVTFAFNGAGTVGTTYELIGFNAPGISVLPTDFAATGANGVFTVLTNQVDFTVVPEPTTLIGGGLFAAMVGWMGFRRVRRERGLALA